MDTTRTPAPTPHPRSTPPAPTVWPALNYADAPAAIRFLVEAFGFEETVAYPGAEAGTVAHAELRWPPGGGIMLGSASAASEAFQGRPTGVASTYLVTADPDSLFARAVAAGAEVVRGLVDEDYDSRGFTVRDAEGNLWSFGTYRGEPAGS
jgi:uncharacterized glyoxalase superfamily protein PhnB